MKKKVAQSTIANREAQKKKAKEWYALYKLYNQKKVPDITMNNLAEHLLDWINNDSEKLFFEEFLHLYHLTEKTFNNFVSKSTKLAEAKEYTMERLSVVRERRAYQENYYSTFRHTQGLYSKKWKAQEQHFADLRQNNAPQTETKIIVMDTFGNRLNKDADETKR